MSDSPIRTPTLGYATNLFYEIAKPIYYTRRDRDWARCALRKILKEFTGDEQSILLMYIFSEVLYPCRFYYYIYNTPIANLKQP
jgi:hypothetical protein